MTDIATNPTRPDPRAPEDLGQLAGRLLAQHSRERLRLNRIADWYAGRVGDQYSPRRATTEFRQLVEMSRMNVLPLVIDTAAQGLYVDGYRADGATGRPESADNAPVWDEAWQPNRMDARQATLWRQALKYGWSFARVEPAQLNGSAVPRITPLSPRRATALYDDPANDEWPIAAMVCQRVIPLQAPAVGADPLATPNIDDGVEIEIVDQFYVYKLRRVAGKWVTDSDAAAHGFGVVPIVRFPAEMGDDDNPDIISTGKVEPLIPAQQQINQISYQLAMALQYGAFRQRWATGMTIERDANGNVIPPFNAAVDLVWFNTEQGGRFGDFAQTDIGGYLEARDKVMLYIAAAGQIPPHNLITGSGISNLSAEALVALESARRADTRSHQYTFGEATEQLLRLCGLAMGDTAAWADMSSEVRWADTTPRSMAQVADALLKLRELEIPVTRLWELIPGTTDQQLADWRADRLAEQRSRVAELAALVDEQRAMMTDPETDDDDISRSPAA